MKLPESVLSQVEGMVRGMLPYEDQYDPVSDEGKLLHDIYINMSEQSERLSEWDGVINKFVKNIDESKELQKKVQVAAVEIESRLFEYFKKVNDAK